jgi:hypothetical protein
MDRKRIVEFGQRRSCRRVQLSCQRVLEISGIVVIVYRHRRQPFYNYNGFGMPPQITHTSPEHRQGITDTSPTPLESTEKRRRFWVICKS